ncbi:hypothetical protein JCM10213_002748 [Rhodosporidiobolus nylandii]
MLSAARRSLLPSGSPFALLDRLAALSLLAPSSPFSTSTAQHEAPRVRLSKAKRAERSDKLAKKREVRAVRREREDRKEELKRMAAHRKADEVNDKRDIGEEISDALPPFSDEQLEAMYQGLLLASPVELASPLLPAPPAASALPDPDADSLERQERLSLLEMRLQEIEGELEMEAQTEEEREGLAARLRRRREAEDGAQQEEKVEAEEAGVPVLAESPARQLLERIEGLLPAEASEAPPLPLAEGAEVALPTGLLSRAEWSDLVLACAEEGDQEGVEKALRLMDRTTPIREGKILEETLALYSANGRTQDALALANFARQNSLPLSRSAHHQLLTTLLPSHPELALQHLQSMECAGHTPLLATYTAVVHRLVSPYSPPHLVREGWNLYAQTRAVAYPIPDVPLFSTMILACSTGAHPAPERAIDLFTEMTHDNRLPPSEMAFNGVIRACAREGSEEYYYEALRYLRRMLDENVRPSRHTFHAVLEGAKRHGDLARARWMLVKMIGIGGDCTPNEKTLALLLQTYAAYRPESRDRNVRKGRSDDARQAGDREAEGAEGEDAKGEEEGGQRRKRPSAVLEPEQDPTNLPTSSSLSPSPSSTSSSTQAVIELLGEASLFYPGPLPTTSAEVAAEAKNLMLQVVEPTVLAPPSSAASADASPAPASDANASPADSMFPSVLPSTFLLNSYLSVLNSHAPLPSSVAFFSHAYDALALPKNRFTFEVLMRRCELAKDPQGAVRVAKGVFEEWLKWRDEKIPESGEEGEELGQKEREIWVKERTDGGSARKMWGGMIRVLARAFEESDALSVLKRFVSLYPPHALSKGVVLPRLPPAPLPAPSHPSALPPLPIKLASPLYPETAPPLDSLRPPFLLFEDLQLLHLRLANMEDEEGLAFVKWVGKAYEAALREGRRREARRND